MNEELRTDQAMMTVLWTGALVGGFVLLLILATKDERSVADKIVDSCKREFPYSLEQQNACILAASSTFVDAANKAKMDRVMRDAR